jgi:hypothetical protein
MTTYSAAVAQLPALQAAQIAAQNAVAIARAAFATAASATDQAMAATRPGPTYNSSADPNALLLAVSAARSTSSRAADVLRAAIAAESAADTAIVALLASLPKLAQAA